MLTLYVFVMALGCILYVAEALHYDYNGERTNPNRTRSGYTTIYCHYICCTPRARKFPPSLIPPTFPPFHFPSLPFYFILLLSLPPFLLRSPSVPPSLFTSFSFCPSLPFFFSLLLSLPPSLPSSYPLPKRIFELVLVDKHQSIWGVQVRLAITSVDTTGL